MNRWVPHRLRVRLTLWSVTVTVFVLGVYAAGVFFLVQRNASSALDDRLRSDFRWATEMAEQRSDGTLAWFDGDEWSEESPWLQVWSADGELVYQTAVARRLPVPQSSELARNANGQIVTVPTTAEPFRLLAGPATVGNRPIVVQVGRSEALMRRERRELALVLLLGLPLSVAAAAVGGYSLARRALGPVDGMAERARAVTATSLSDRLPIDNPHDELGRLASVFNTMLGRLESSFEQMRSFAADVSHELRTPLTAIRSVGEVALREPRNDESYRAAIGSMLEDVDRLTRLTERLLLLSRADSGQLTLSIDTVDLRDLADDVTGQLGVLAEEKHQSMTIEHEGRPVCQADQVVLRQAVINLVDNAIKFTPTGGTIRIRAAETDGQATLEVHDTGPGIPGERQPRMFERFDRGGRPDGAGGVGLGLAIAKWAVEANLGKLSYEHPQGEGSIFRMSFPMPLLVASLRN
jgi:heavy metal sensor kinase